MANPINFIVTSAGRDAIYDASSDSVKLSIAKVGLGTGQYQPDAGRTTLAAEFTQKTIAAGGVELESFAMRFTVIMGYVTEKNVSELGLYTNTGVLFAVASLPAGSFFRLYPGINFVASMGLLLDTALEANTIEIAVDGTAGQALQIMNAHVTEEDPHPQYRDYSIQVMQEHLAAEDPHPQYALKSFLSDQLNELDEKVESLLGVTEYFFPSRLVCGYDIAETIVTERKKGAIFALTDTAQVYLFCPEAAHEAWSTAREAEKVSTSVFIRSGTSRGGYNGRGNYAVIDTAQVLLKSGFGAETNQLSNMIKAGTIEAGKSPIILKGASETLNYNSSDLVVLISPEGTHEGWSISRAADKITIDVFNRSGTSRTTYSGRINWALFKVNAVPAAIRPHYPLNLTSGVADSGSFTIPAPAGHDFTDPLYFPVITPEGQNEYWTVKRSNAGFVVEVFNRSGSSPAAYTGKVGWAVFVIDRPMKRTVYYEGVHKIMVQPGKMAKFALYGPGGGGASSRYTTQSGPIDGGNGEATKITKGTLELSAGGGLGGTGGWWGNGSHYDNGHAGLGGVNSVSNLLENMQVLKDVPGNAAVIGSRYATQPGGVATSLDSGLSVSNAGGTGGWGVGDENWSYGGGGGSGGYLFVEFENKTNTAIEFDLTVGKAGAHGTTGNIGTDGGVGFAIVSEEV